MSVRSGEGVAALVQLLLGLCVTLVAFPLTLLIRRDRGLTVFIGRNQEAFSDNTKYFYSYLAGRGAGRTRSVFLSSNRDTVARIRVAGGVAEAYPGWKACLLLLRCRYLIVDAPCWGDNGVYALSRGATLVQLWHGAPLKQIELDVFRARLASSPTPLRLLLKLQKAVIGRYPRYDTLLCTSVFFAQRAFSTAFDAREVVTTGYPRNDILLTPPASVSPAWRLLSINVDEVVHSKVRQAKGMGMNVCLIMPTFRGAGDDTLQSILDLDRLSGIARRCNALFVFKLHPYVGASYDLESFPGLVQCSASSDVYPLLRSCDILVTDYSSVYFDYLLLDRPIIFLPYDLQDYTSRDRPMYFNYAEMAPGPHCVDMEELAAALERELSATGGDDYDAERKRVRSLAHDNSAGGFSVQLAEHLGL